MEKVEKSGFYGADAVNVDATWGASARWAESVQNRRVEPSLVQRHFLTRERAPRAKRSGAERSGVERSAAERSGAE